jgi:hypothetical protein
MILMRSEGEQTPYGRDSFLRPNVTAPAAESKRLRRQTGCSIVLDLTVRMTVESRLAKLFPATTSWILASLNRATARKTRATSFTIHRGNPIRTTLSPSGQEIPAQPLRLRPEASPPYFSTPILHRTLLRSDWKKSFRDLLCRHGTTGRPSLPPAQTSLQVVGLEGHLTFLSIARPCLHQRSPTAHRFRRRVGRVAQHGPAWWSCSSATMNEFPSQDRSTRV